MSIAPKLAKTLFDLGDKGCTDEEIQQAIEKALAEQRCDTYRDLISLLRNYRGVAHGLDQIEILLCGMIRSEKKLYGLEEQAAEEKRT